MQKIQDNKKETESIGIYLRVIEIDHPNTNCAEKTKLINETFNLNFTEEEVFNYYHVDEEPDYEWLNDIARNR